MGSAADIAAAVNKVFGAGTMKMASDPKFVVKYIPTGVLAIDCLLGGGIPKGRATEIYGPYSSFKSYIALCTAAGVQQSGGVAAIIDTEHSFDPDIAESVGVDLSSLIVERPSNGEFAVDLTEVLVRSGVDLVVWDSVAATLPKAEEEKMAGDKQQPARLAALMSAAMRKINTANDSTALLFINQTREKVGVTYGSPESIPGGKSLPFYASYRIGINKVGSDKDETKTWDGKEFKTGKRVVRQKMKATLTKSKLSAPDRDVIFTFDFRTGEIDEVGFLISQGLELGIIQKGAKEWKMKGSKTSKPNAPAFRGWIESNPSVLARLKEKVLVGNGLHASSKDD